MERSVCSTKKKTTPSRHECGKGRSRRDRDIPTEREKRRRSEKPARERPRVKKRYEWSRPPSRARFREL